MKPLRHAVALGAGETPPSFASRLAAMRRLSGRDFCLDFGTTFQKVVDGDPKALAMRLAGIPGVVEHGLFIGLVGTAIIAGAGGVRVVGAES